MYVCGDISRAKFYLSFFSQLLSNCQRRHLMCPFFSFFFFFCRYRRGSGCDEYRVDLRHSRLPLPPRRGVPPISRCKHSRCIRTHTSCMHVCSDVFVCLCLEFFLAVSPCSQLSRPCIIFHIAHFWIFYSSLFSSYSLEFACVCFLNLVRGLQR
jgi:hypothetical protein